MGDVKLPSGLSAHFEYHHDRNALKASCRDRDVLFAVSRSGSLLRFDARTLKHTGEWFGPVAATCLGSGEPGSVLVGFADGPIVRLS